MSTPISDHAPPSAGAARALFPRGLEQPPGSFRFAADALLLAAFAASAPLPPAPARSAFSRARLDGPPGALADALDRTGVPDRTGALTDAPAPLVADLGAGCGVVAFALLLARPECAGLGLELRPELVAAANANAARLGLADRYRCLAADLADPARPARQNFPPSASCALVLANPPYRQRDKGRLPLSAARRDALFERPGALDAFCAVAAFLLSPGGRFCIAYPHSREQTLLDALARHSLAPTRRLLILPRRGAAPALVLFEAASAATAVAAGLIRQPPLALHQGRGTNTRFSPEALRFCPWLRPGA